ncbi:MAG: hypothetical protein H6Q05_2021, partial [Acidobacteria bacterium]|nr:hypothetical protein [Acidobacteriota bacterium]
MLKQGYAGLTRVERGFHFERQRDQD